jgi:hypothetical protein
MLRKRAGGTEPARASDAFFKTLDLNQFGCDHGSNDELRDPVAPLDSKRLATVVH